MTLDIRTGSLLPPASRWQASRPPHRLTACWPLEPCFCQGVTPGTRIDLGRHQQMWGLLPLPDLDRLVGPPSGPASWGPAGGVRPPASSPPGGGDQGAGDRQRFRGGVRQRWDTVLLLHVPTWSSTARWSLPAPGQPPGDRADPESRPQVIAAVAAAIDERHDKVSGSPSSRRRHVHRGRSSAVISSWRAAPEAGPHVQATDDADRPACPDSASQQRRGRSHAWRSRCADTG